MAAEHPTEVSRHRLERPAIKNYLRFTQLGATSDATAYFRPKFTIKCCDESSYTWIHITGLKSRFTNFRVKRTIAQNANGVQVIGHYFWNNHLILQGLNVAVEIARGSDTVVAHYLIHQCFSASTYLCRGACGFCNCFFNSNKGIAFQARIYVIEATNFAARLRNCATRSEFLIDFCYCFCARRCQRSNGNSRCAAS